MQEKDEIAIIKNPAFGMVPGRGEDLVALRFEVSMAVCSAGVFFYGQDALTFVKENEIKNIEDLHGKPCIVRSAGWGSTVKFVRLMEI